MTFCPVCYRQHRAGEHTRPSAHYGGLRTDTSRDPSTVCHTCQTPTMIVAGTHYCASHGVVAEEQVTRLREQQLVTETYENDARVAFAELRRAESQLEGR